MMDKTAIAWHYKASQEAVNTVLEAPVADDGRSEWRWLRLNNGDLALILFPRGDTYFDVEIAVEGDYQQALVNDDIRTMWMDTEVV